MNAVSRFFGHCARNISAIYRVNGLIIAFTLKGDLGLKYMHKQVNSGKNSFFSS